VALGWNGDIRYLAPMRASERFRQNALDCERAAARSSLPSDREAFAQMAGEWRLLEQAAIAAEAAEPDPAPEC
jgi:hypothetical protein